jgi:hypothetical protein
MNVNLLDDGISHYLDVGRYERRWIIEDKR